MSEPTKNPNLISEVKGYVGYALSEFQALNWMDEDGNYDDDLQELVCKNTIELLEVLHKQGYSGASIDYALSLFQKLALFKPLSALTGDADEWQECFGDKPNYFQNRRCGRVFKDNGIAYNNTAFLFEYGDDGSTFSALPYSRQYINAWPYPVPSAKVIILPMQYKEGGIDTIPETEWAELGMTIQRENVR